jgi:2'-5' RNA ligase
MPGAEPDARARLFVALELGAEGRSALVAWGGLALRRPELSAFRPAPASNLHVTLCFLGMIEVGEIDAISTALDRVVPGFDGGFAGLSLGEEVLLPPRRPRVLAIGIVDPEGALASLQAGLSDALAAGGWYRPEARPFLAHVTVARARRGSSVRVRDFVAPGVQPVSVHPPAVILYRSVLGGGGARYEALRRITLG